MPTRVVDATPAVLQFRDSNPLTDGMANLAAALWRAPQIQRDAQDRRLDQDLNRQLKQAQLAQMQAPKAGKPRKFPSMIARNLFGGETLRGREEWVADARRMNPDLSPEEADRLYDQFSQTVQATPGSGEGGTVPDANGRPVVDFAALGNTSPTSPASPASPVQSVGAAFLDAVRAPPSAEAAVQQIQAENTQAEPAPRHTRSRGLRGGRGNRRSPPNEPRPESAFGPGAVRTEAIAPVDAAARPTQAPLSFADAQTTPNPAAALFPDLPAEQQQAAYDETVRRTTEAQDVEPGYARRMFTQFSPVGMLLPTKAPVDFDAVAEQVRAEFAQPQTQAPGVEQIFHPVLGGHAPSVQTPGGPLQLSRDEALALQRAGIPPAALSVQADPVEQQMMLDRAIELAAESGNFGLMRRLTAVSSGAARANP